MVGIGRRKRVKAAALLLVIIVFGFSSAGGQSPREPAPPATPAQFKAVIDNLGKFDVLVRTSAARTVRRAPAAQAVPVLIEAASGHADGYVRFRALVLLS